MDLKTDSKKRRKRKVSLVLDFDNTGFFTATEPPLVDDADDDEQEREKGEDSIKEKQEEEEEDEIEEYEAVKEKRRRKRKTQSTKQDTSATATKIGPVFDDGTRIDVSDVRSNVKDGASRRDADVEIADQEINRRGKRLPEHAPMLICMILMVGLFAAAELIVGFATESLAMLSDSFHMLSDVLSLVVGFIAMWLAAKREADDSKTYGWKRAEVVGGLVNGVFLVSVCFYTLTEAIVRLIEGPPSLREPWLIFGVGVGGLVINLIGMCMFCSHRSLSTHHGHAHSHSHSHSHSSSAHNVPNDADDDHVVVRRKVNAHGDDCDKECDRDGNNSADETETHKQHARKQSNVNLHGVFLHVLGDTLGSVVVIGTALVYLFAGGDAPDGSVAAWKPYLDPSCSILFSLFILRAAVPLLRHTIDVLMQSAPAHFDLDVLRQALLGVRGVATVHELHVWQQTASDFVGTVHIETAYGVENDAEHMQSLHRQVKKTFCKFGVHRTTVQCETTSQQHRCEHRSCRSFSDATQSSESAVRRSAALRNDDDEHSCCQMTTSSSSVETSLSSRTDVE